MEMDLSWCIICDKRIMDDELSDSSRSLYCSLECQLKDQSKSLQSFRICDATDDMDPLDGQQLSAYIPRQTSLLPSAPYINSTDTIKNAQQSAYSSLSSALEKVKPWMTKKAAKHHLYKTTNPSSTIYPWVPSIHRRRRNYLTIPRRCVQSTVASSFTTANGILSS